MPPETGAAPNPEPADPKDPALTPDPAPDPDNPPAGDDPDPADPADPGDDPDPADPADPDADGDGDAIASAAELIEHFEADPEWFEGLKVEVKVDGKPATATIRDLVKSYQIGEAAEHRLEEAKSKVRAVNQELTEKSKALEGQFAQAAALIQAAEQALDADVAGIDWNKLREEDEGAYAAKKADVAERRERLAKLKKDAVSSWQQATEKAQIEGREKLVEFVQEQAKALLKAIPEWADETKRKAEKAELGQYLLGQGFTNEDINSPTIDHRLVVMARKAMLHDRSQQKVAAAKKKVAKVPKVLKPGAKPSSKPNKPRDAASILYR
jgi:DNA-binding ferritin-like protein